MYLHILEILIFSKSIKIDAHDYMIMKPKYLSISFFDQKQLRKNNFVRKQSIDNQDKKSKSLLREDEKNKIEGIVNKM